MDILDVLAKMDERLERQDRILAAQLDAFQALQTMMDRQNQILLTINHSVERVSQHTVRIAQLCAEHTLCFDRLMQASRALDARLAARE